MTKPKPGPNPDTFEKRRAKSAPRVFRLVLDQPENPPHLEDDTQPWLLASDTLEKALRTFNAEGVARLAVVSTTDPGQIIGWANRVDALNTFNNALIDAHVEAHR